ncbi:MAG: Glucosamine-fructose-6-phosphate aminotransferase, isomerising, partial [Myxococcaceae bacterium]|nr:Glucosamine-fructose-6-phosphate aminotransferase, isomerising [Myxococcaceae bacterium]
GDEDVRKICTGDGYGPNGPRSARSQAQYEPDIVEIPAAASEVLPLLTVLPLQLLAYHVADLKGTDVDQPRNLAKTVTVE